MRSLLWIGLVLNLVQLWCWLLYFTGSRRDQLPTRSISTVDHQQSSLISFVPSIELSAEFNRDSNAYYGFSSQIVQQDSKRIIDAMQSESCAKSLRIHDFYKLPVRIVLSHQFKFIYVDIHKAASSTIRILLARVFGANHSYKKSLLRPPELPLDRDTLVSTDISSKTFQSYFVFTFVRDPISRFGSSFHEYQRQSIANGNDLGSVLSISDALDRLLSGNRVNAHFKSQMDQLYGSTSDGDRFTFDFVGSVESIYRDFSYVLSHLGRVPTPSIPRSNRRRLESVHNESLKQTTAEERSNLIKICKLYANDFKCLGYTHQVK